MSIVIDVEWLKRLLDDFEKANGMSTETTQWNLKLMTAVAYEVFKKSTDDPWKQKSTRQRLIHCLTMLFTHGLIEAKERDRLFYVIQKKYPEGT